MSHQNEESVTQNQTITLILAATAEKTDFVEHQRTLFEIKEAVLEENQSNQTDHTRAQFIIYQFQVLSRSTFS